MIMCNQIKRSVTLFMCMFLFININGKIVGPSLRAKRQLEDLGQRISEQVQRSLEPLNGLGERINHQVQQQVAPLEGLGDRINLQVQRKYPDLGSRISQNVERQMAPLQNLGDQINAQVQQSLEPVRALELVNKMKNGVGGITIAEHQPSGRTFLIRNYQIFECEGNVDWNEQKCLGNETKFSVKQNEDWCFAQPFSYTRINDKICLSTGPISVSVINNQVFCATNDNHNQTLFMDIDDFVNMCKGKSSTVNYKYFADSNNPHRVEIPNKNQYVRCNNNQANVCEFSVNLF